MPKKATVPVPKDYLAGLEKKVEDLRTLIDVSAIISSTFDFSELLTLVMEKTKKVMSAEACSILLYNSETKKLEFEVALGEQRSALRKLKEKVVLDMGKGIAGWVAKNMKPLIIENAEADGRFYKGADKLTGFKTRSLIAAPLIGRSGLIGVAEILNPKNKDCFNKYDAEIFQTHCRQVAVAIENARFHRASIEREKLRQELDIASSVQKSFLPGSPIFKKGNIIASAVNISASKVGGDLYDFTELANGRAGILVGDVSGKGVSAALYMAKVLSEFRYISHVTVSPEETLNRLNSGLSASPRGMFLTAIYLIVDTVTGDMHLSVAGHPPFLWLTRREARVMTVPAGPPLGILPVDYSAASLSLKKGDRLILLTDGVFDAKNRHGKRIGFDRLIKFIKRNRKEKQLLKRVVDFVNDFSENAERTDDLTLVEVSRL
jgi:sigma-B regulation protein RsbU (phosphoserine phosphatase)